MLETTSQLSVNDNKSEGVQRNDDLISLPFIPAKPSSRGSAQHRR